VFKCKISGQKSGQIKGGKKMPRKGENIRKRKDGRWEGRYTDKSTNPPIVRSIYGKSYAEVKKTLLNIKASLSMLENIDYNILFQEVLNDWLKEKQNTIKKSSYVKYESCVLNHIIPHIGKIKFSKLNDDRIIEFFDVTLIEKKELSNSILKTVLYIIKSSIEFGNEKYYTHIKIKYKIKPRKQPELTLFNSDEISKIITITTISNNCRDLGILLSLCCGLRIGEVCALKWSDIDTDNGTIYITRTVQRLKSFDEQQKTEIVIGSPKSISSTRTIPLPDFLNNHLCKLRNIKNPDSFVLSGNNNLLEPRLYQYYFKSFLRDANLKNSNFHILRHTFATRCVEKGVDVKSLSEILGHSSVSITLNRYVHPTIEQKRIQLEKLFIMGQNFISQSCNTVQM